MHVCISLQLSNNGVISFTQPITHYSPEEFPVDYPAVAPFWADVDTTAVGAVWYRVTTDPEIVLLISGSVEQHFNVEGYFPYEVAVVTWDHVGHFSESTDPVSHTSLVHVVYNCSVDQYFPVCTGYRWCQIIRNISVSG